MLNVAVVGFGWWGKHIATRLRGNTRLRVVTVVEPVAERYAEIKTLGADPEPSLSAALGRADIHAVVLTTPNPFHEEQVVASAAAGKHVFCEKPLGLTGASARRSVAACVDAGVVLGIGHERRFEPALQELARMVAAGEFGTIMHAEAAFSHDKLIGVAPGDWRTSKAVSPAAGMTAMGVHLTDLYIALFGRVATVQAMTSRRVLEWETGDVVTVQLGFEGGMTATLNAILYTPHFIRTQVFGSRQWVEIRNDTHPDTPGGVAEMTIARTGQPHEIRRFDWTDTVVANLDAFADAIDGIAPYPYTNEQMIHNIELLEAIAASAESRETVKLFSNGSGR
jgi:predicted dehydrogenase